MRPSTNHLICIRIINLYKNLIQIYYLTFKTLSDKSELPQTKQKTDDDRRNEA